MTNTTIRSWMEELDIQFDIFRWSRKPVSQAGVGVAFRGEYHLSHARRDAGVFMRMAVGAALSWPQPGRGLIVDCRSLVYRGGDDFFLWAGLPARFNLPPDRFNLAIIVSERNEKAIQSLAVDNQMEEIVDHLFLNFEDGIDFICGDTG